ncbi:MAG: stage V sporulation protein B [Bacillota bacterium]
MSKHSFIEGALILFISGIFVKIIGFLFQIVIIRKIGTEAVGLVNMVFPLYITVLVITTAGLPLAISKMVAHQMALDNYKGAVKIFRISLTLLILLSLLITVLLIVFSPILIKLLFKDPRALLCFYAMLPGIIVVSISSAFRGFFQGLQDMKPPAISQCFEQVVRITIALLLISHFQQFGIKAIAIALSISMISGELMGLLIMWGFYIYRKSKNSKQIFIGKNIQGLPAKKIIGELIAFGFPTTLTRLTSSLVLTFEASLIPSTLQKSGYTINQAASIYGQFSGVAITLLTIPTVLTFSLATSLVPSISEAEAQGKIASLQFRSTEALRLTYVFGLPVAVVLFLKATSLSSLLFNIPEAGITLRYLAMGAIFLYLVQTSNGILQGLGLVKIVLFNTFVGAIIKVFGIIYLVPNPELHINGAAIAFIFSFFAVCLLNLYFIKIKTGFVFKPNQLIFPLMATLLMGVLIILQTRMLGNYLTDSMNTIISIISSGLIYLILMGLTNQVNLKMLVKKKD